MGKRPPPPEDRSPPDPTPPVDDETPIFETIGPAPRRADVVDASLAAQRTARVSALRVAVESGQYIVDKDAVAKNLVDEELAPKVR